MPPPPLHSQLSPCVCFLAGFPGPQAGAVFLLFFRPSCIGLEMFSGPLVLSVSRGFRFSDPLAVSPVSPPCPWSCVVAGILVSKYVGSSVPFGGASPSPFCSSVFSWLWSIPFSFSSPSLRSVLGGAALRAFLLFSFWSPLGSPFRSVAVSSGVLFSAGSEFLSSLHGWSVGFSKGSAALASLRGQGGLFPGLSLFSAFGLSLFGSLPSSPVTPVSLRPGGCLFPWVSASTTCGLAYSSGACFPGVVCSVVCFRSCSHLRCHGSVFLLHPCLVHRLSLRRLCFFGAFVMRSPLSGSSVGCGFCHSIGTKA